MAGNSCSSRGRRRLAAFPRALLVTAVLLAGTIGSIDAADSADASRQIFTVIVTRHGVRSVSHTPGDYDWPSWEPVEEGFLTEHGYQLMTLMGEFYGEEAQGIPVDCDHGVFVYADKDQRTLLTAQALVKGLCPKFNVPIFHETDMSASDPIFNGAAWLSERGRIDAEASSRAVAALAGSPPSTIVMSHADDFSMFQGLLDTRCAPPKHCAPVAAGASKIEPNE